MAGLPTSFDWGQVNTALIISAIAYMWRQSRVVDQIRQAMLGYGGTSGALGEIRMLRERSHELAGSMQRLSITVEHLSAQIEQWRSRGTPWDGQERREKAP